MINPLYLAYAKATGIPDPDERLARDREEYPGGCMCGFTLWMSEKFQQWEKSNPKPGDGFFNFHSWIHWNIEKVHDWILTTA